MNDTDLFNLLNTTLSNIYLLRLIALQTGKDISFDDALEMYQKDREKILPLLKHDLLSQHPANKDDQ